MSENERTPEQILEEANAFFENTGVTAALEEFLCSDSVREEIGSYAKDCENAIQELIDSQDTELAAKAEDDGVNVDTIRLYEKDFPNNFRIFLLLDHVEVLRAYGMDDETIGQKMADAFISKAPILHRLLQMVAQIQWSNRYEEACYWLEQLEANEEDVQEEPITSENCGETNTCKFNQSCQNLGCCLKGVEFHCNGKGAASGECNCPGRNSCFGGEGGYPCQELGFTVIPPEGGCCECGVD